MVVLGVAVSSALAADYSITSSVIAGGGGQSSGGNYTLTGTIGQTDAGQMSGGNYSLAGGFWSAVVVVPTPDAPKLNIRFEGQNVVVSWPSDSEGFGLQEKAFLNMPNWNSSARAITDDGTTKSVIIAPAGGMLYLRLIKPGP